MSSYSLYLNHNFNILPIRTENFFFAALTGDFLLRSEEHDKNLHFITNFQMC